MLRNHFGNALAADQDPAGRFSIKPPVKNMISYWNHDMPTSNNGNAQKCPCQSDQPTIYRAMRVKNIRLSTSDNFYQEKQGWQTEGPFHGQGKIGQVMMAELTTSLPKRTVRWANNGNTVPAFEQ